MNYGEKLRAVVAKKIMFALKVNELIGRSNDYTSM